MGMTNAAKKTPFAARLAFIRDMIECATDCGNAAEATHWQGRLDAVMAQGEAAFNAEHAAKTAPAKVVNPQQSSEFGYVAAAFKHNDKVARRSKKFGLD